MKFITTSVLSVGIFLVSSQAAANDPDAHGFLRTLQQGSGSMWGDGTSGHGMMDGSGSNGMMFDYSTSGHITFMGGACMMMGGAITGTSDSTVTSSAAAATTTVAGEGGAVGAVLSCVAPRFACDMHNGSNGTFVCSSWTHPMTGDLRSRAMCIPSSMALSGSTSENCTLNVTCGCCVDNETGDELTCPIRPDYVTTMACDNSTQPDLPGVMMGFLNSASMASSNGTNNSMTFMDRNIMCRNLVNPFTGDDQPTTLIVPQNGSIKGDTCGCCEGGCPTSTEAPVMFPRPKLVEKSCSNNNNNDTANYQECDLPSWMQDEGQGFFVCREFYDPRGLVETRKEAVCISSTHAWETDQCGCCEGMDCPQRSVAVDSQCSVDEHGCDLQSGQVGVFVCRTIFHPSDGLPRERGFCVPLHLGWMTDVCGCCAGNEGGDTETAACPTTPPGGFEDESVQMARLALEVPADYGVVSTTGITGEGGSTEDSSSSTVAFPWALFALGWVARLAFL